MKKIDILRRLLDQNHITLEELLVLLREDEAQGYAIPISKEDIEKLPHLFIIKT